MRNNTIRGGSDANQSDLLSMRESFRGGIPDETQGRNKVNHSKTIDQTNLKN